MDIKVSNITPTNQAPAPEQVQEATGDFKFVLTSKLEDTGLAERLNIMLQDIVQQGERISKRNDIKDMQRYRILIKDFLNEVVTRSHVFPGKISWTGRAGTGSTVLSGRWTRSWMSWRRNW